MPGGDPFFTDVVLLCHADGSNGDTTFTDVSPLAHTLTAIDTTVSTATPKFGTGCADFTAAGDACIDTGNASDFSFPGTFTVEVWAYVTGGHPANGMMVGTLLTSGFSPEGWAFYFSDGGTVLAFEYYDASHTIVTVFGSYTQPLNTWLHLAADRDVAGVIRVYADGVVIASLTGVGPVNASGNTCRIGRSELNHTFPGYLDDIRITKGVARYAGAFTPPTTTYPDTAAPLPFELPPHVGTTRDTHRRPYVRARFEPGGQDLAGIALADGDLGDMHGYGDIWALPAPPIAFRVPMDFAAAHTRAQVQTLATFRVPRIEPHENPNWLEPPEGFMGTPVGTLPLRNELAATITDPLGSSIYVVQ